MAFLSLASVAFLSLASVAFLSLASVAFPSLASVAFLFLALPDAKRVTTLARVNLSAALLSPTPPGAGARSRHFEIRRSGWQTGPPRPGRTR